MPDVVSKILYLLIIFTVIANIHCAKIQFGEETENGHWGSRHLISFPFAVGGKHYFFGLTDISNGRYWFIQELKDNGKTGVETSTGTWDNNYTKIFPFAIDDKQYIYGISDNKYWFIREILPGGLMSELMDHGIWKLKPTIIFPFDVGGKHFVYTLSDRNWFIQELLPNGKMGSQTDSGAWTYYYTIGFPYSINGRQFFYCVSEKYWFIQELVPGGKMGVETDNGHWTTNHIRNVPFNIDGKYYFYGLTELSDNRHWLIQELLPGGKMGAEMTSGTWQYSYELLFAFKINGRQYLYGLSEYYWFIQEIVQDRRLPIVAVKKEIYCNCRKVLRKKRQIDGTCNAGCSGLNAVEEQVNRIENDDNNYDTMTFSNPADPIKSVSTFRVAGDANHPNHIDLTAAIRAEIHYSHMRPVRHPGILTPVRNHLRQMDRENDDDAGHLLASSLGGPNLPYNFAPQSPMVNRAVNVAGSVVQSGWYGTEAMLRDYLIENHGYIRWSMEIQYALLPNSRRPTAFLLSVRFYNDQGDLVNWRGQGAVISYNFPNVPTSACTNLNH